MPAAAIWRWVLLWFARSPLVGVLWLGLLLCVPLVEGIRPLPSSRSTLDIALAWALPAGLLGTALGLTRLSYGQDFLVRLSPRTRWGGELGALVAVGIYLQLPILAGASLTGTEALDLARALPDILTLDLRLAGIALLFLVPPLSTALRASLFLCTVWLAPGLCGRIAGLASLAAVLDPGSALRARAAEGLLPVLAAASALVLAGYLLRTSPARRASP